MTADPLVPAEALLDADGRVAADAPCLSCGYNLRSLPAAGLCPECARPVRTSLQGERLCYASPVWVKRMARGASIILVTLVVSIIGAIVGYAAMISMVVSAGSGAVPTPGSPMRMLAWAMMALGTATLAALVVGLILLTGRNPVPTFRREGWSARRVTRVLMCVPALTLVLAVLKMSRTYAPLWTLGSFPGALTIPLRLASVVALFLAYVALPLAVLRHIIGLLRRIPRPGLALFCRIEFWGYLAAGATLTVGYGIFVYAVVSMWPAITAAGASAAASAPTSMTVNAQQVAPYGVWSQTTNVQFGTTTATSSGVPATATIVAPFPSFGPWFMLGSGLMGLGFCGEFALVLAGFVLLILVQRALARAAKEAEQNAHAFDLPALAPLPESPSPRIQA